MLRFLVVLSLCAAAGWSQTRAIGLPEYRDKVHGAWLGQIAGAIFGWPFEGKARNAVELDRYLKPYTFAPVDDDYFYEMVALYGFERFGTGMTVGQLGEIWKEYRAGSWGSSEQARLALERGVAAPMTGHPRHNRWFHTIGPQFSADLYGMIAPGMANLAGEIARRHSHVNGYAEGSDGAVFMAACVSEAFFETDTVKIVRQAAGLIDPRSNYRQAIEQALAQHAAGMDWREAARRIEDRWRPEYPQMNNAVPNGALVALGLLYGGGDYLKTLNIITQAGDNTDADCNAANAGAVIGAMHGVKAVPRQLAEPLRDRIFGDRMGPVAFGRTIDESISGLAARIAALGEKILLENGASRQGGRLVMPLQQARTQPLEAFDINEYAGLWSPGWTMENAGRGGAGTTWLDGGTLVTFPREGRPVMLRREAPAGGKLTLGVSAAPGHPWRLEVFAGIERLAARTIEGDTDLALDLPAAPGGTVTLRLYHWLISGKAPGSARWRKAEIGSR